MRNASSTSPGGGAGAGAADAGFSGRGERLDEADDVSSERDGWNQPQPVDLGESGPATITDLPLDVLAS